MLKLVALISAKPNISREAFIEHYESTQLFQVEEYKSA